jgi:hypothetical protein
VVLLSAQLAHGQQEPQQDAGTSQPLVRIPIPAIKGIQDIPAVIFRENIREDSVDIAIDPDELEGYLAKYPGLRILKAAPLLDNTDMAASLAEAMTFRKYPTYEQYDSMMHHFAASYPSICRIDTFGTSVEGRLLLALKISDNVEQHEDEPAFMYSSTMHGDELVGYVLCLRLADFLLSNYGTDVEVDRIINGVELWINPLSNPDGTFYPDNNSTVQASRRSNVNGVDLNRNFPDPKTGEADDPSGRQQETRHMMDFLGQIRPNLSANIHSGAEVVNYPWDHKQAWHPDQDWLILISREYADEARSVNSSYLMFADDSLGYTGITNGADWYEITGGRQDYVTYYLHGRELTLELSNVKRLESEYLEHHWNYNKWPMINLVTQSLYGIHGNVTDNYGNPVRARIWVQEHDNDSSWVESDPVSGNFYRYLAEGVYDLLVTSEGYASKTLHNTAVFDYQETTVSVQLDSLHTGSRPDKRTIHPVNNGADDPYTPLQVHPNPAHEMLRVKTTGTFSAETVITLTDLSGRTLLQVSPPAGAATFSMDVSALQNGVYLLYRSGYRQSGVKVIIR